MAFARDVYTATGGQTDFTISFSYLEQDDVVVSQNGTTLTLTTEYTFPNATTIRLVTGATVGDTIVIQRNSDQSARNVIWAAGSLTSNDLNDADKQLFNMAQEAIDIANTAMGLDTDDQWTAESKRIKDVATPTASTDATNKSYVDTAVLTGTPGTPLAVADGGTGSATAAAARTALGLEIGTDVTAFADTAKLGVANVFTKSQTWLKGADVASAAALAVDIDGNFFDVTGTTAITSINTKGVGTEIVLQFDGALTLTHHATDLILPGGANITTAAGDIARFYEYATGDWRCEQYTKASGKPVEASSTIGTSQATTSGTAFDFTIPAGVKKIIMSLQGVSLTGTDGLSIQIGDSGGVETTGYDSAGARLPNAAAIATGSSATGFIIPTNDASFDTRGHVVLTLENPDFSGGGTNDPLWVYSFNGKANNTTMLMASGSKLLTSELTTVRFTRSGSNTFDAGEVNVWYE